MERHGLELTAGPASRPASSVCLLLELLGRLCMLMALAASYTLSDVVTHNVHSIAHVSQHPLLHRGCLDLLASPVTQQGARVLPELYAQLCAAHCCKMVASAASSC